MPSGWDVYYIVFLSALIALGIPLFLAAVSYLVSPQSRGRKKRTTDSFGKQFNATLADATHQNETRLGDKMNARFFLGVNAALILMTMMLLLVPCVGALQPGTDPEMLLRGCLALISVAFFAGVGLLYSSSKGDLSWLKSYRQPGEHDDV